MMKTSNKIALAAAALCLAVLLVGILLIRTPSRINSVNGISVSGTLHANINGHCFTPIQVVPEKGEDIISASIEEIRMETHSHSLVLMAELTLLDETREYAYCVAEWNKGEPVSRYPSGECQQIGASSQDDTRQIERPNISYIANSITGHYYGPDRFTYLTLTPDEPTQYKIELPFYEPGRYRISLFFYYPDAEAGQFDESKRIEFSFVIDIKPPKEDVDLLDAYIEDDVAYFVLRSSVGTVLPEKEEVSVSCNGSKIPSDNSSGQVLNVRTYSRTFERHSVYNDRGQEIRSETRPIEPLIICIAVSFADTQEISPKTFSVPLSTPQHPELDYAVTVCFDPC